MNRFITLLIFTLAVTSLAVLAQNPAPAGSSQAKTICGESMIALTNGVAVNDVTLIGNVTVVAGSDTQTGTATFAAASTNRSRIEMNLDNGKRTDIQDDSRGVPTGVWSVNDGALKPYASHNTWNDASWFFPALGSLSDPSVNFSYVGVETRNGVSVQHLRSQRTNSAIPTAQKLSGQDIYLDATTLLPVALVFNLHPDNNSNINIPVEVRFANYQLKSGLMVPLRIQKFVNYGLVLDFQISNVIANSGIPANQFSVE